MGHSQAVFAFLPPRSRLVFSPGKDYGSAERNETMIATVKNLAETAVLLPPKDRTYLAERLLASLEDSEIEQQWRTEAKRRRDEIRSGRVKPIPAEEVYRRIERLLVR
jgi:putative addiction module component (TIGR02574 family)